MKYNFIELKTDEDLIDMWRSFRCRLTKGSIELDAKISRSVDDIIKMLNYLVMYNFSCFLITPPVSTRMKKAKKSDWRVEEGSYMFITTSSS